MPGDATGATIVFETIAALLLVIGAGALARRARIIGREGSDGLGRIVADVTFPALCLDGLSRIDGSALAADWAIPLLAIITLGVAAAVGMGASRVAAAPADRPTCAFLIATPNWIFLPLPIAEALHGPAGARIVLLHNAGAQVFLWTAGLLLLRGGRPDRRALVALLKNPGLWATAAGVAIALSGASVEGSDGAVASIARFVRAALAMLGGLTTPLATFAIGAQLAAPTAPEARASTRSILAVTSARLFIAPAACAVVLLAARGMFELSGIAVSTEILIAGMPVSLTAGALVQRFGGSVSLASRAIALSTASSVVTAPLLYHFTT